MGALNQRSKIKAPAPVIRIEKVVVEPKPKPKPRPHLPSHIAAGRPGAAGSRAASSPSLLPPGRVASPAAGTASSLSRRGKSAPPTRDDGDDDDETETKRRKRRAGTAGSGRSPASGDGIKFSDDSETEDDGGWEDTLNPRKRRRRLLGGAAARPPDLDRKLRHPRLWTGGDEEAFAIVHAADVASLAHKCQPTLGVAAEDVGLELRYPGSRQQERYELVYGKDKIDAVRDIMKVVHFVAYTYVGEADAQPFVDPTAGLYRQLQRASSRNVWDGGAFRAAVGEYNRRLAALQESGSIARVLDGLHELPPDLVAFVLEQVYDRTVAPKVELLAKYENGTDNVYGELLPPFVSHILSERLRLRSGQVFVDLGSGVGNVVLQAALEIGCESWGCEMMQNACDLAEAQEREFAARCRLWGLAPGAVHLERGDFRTHARIHEALKRADAVLVNNQAFTSRLNDNLVSLFLDLKPGCKIVSLKSFVHDNKSASNDVAASILEVEHLTYPEGYVSWTGAAGTFCISTRK